MRQKKSPEVVQKKDSIAKKVVVEFAGKQILVSEVLTQAETDYLAKNPDANIEAMELYITPEQNAAYYVVNGESSAEFKVEL